MTEHADETPQWNLDGAQWDAIVERAQLGPDTLRDGAFVRTEISAEGQTELVFYASASNKPLGWGYPFLETIPKCSVRGAFVGRVWHEAEAGRAAFEVALPAAAAALAADYESGTSDLDFVTYEQVAEAAVLGTPADLSWLHQEFGRLAVLTVS